MKEKIEKLKKEAKEKIEKIQNLQELQEMKIKYLGKKSELSSMLKGLGSLSKEERPKVGNLVNEVRKEIERFKLPTNLRGRSHQEKSSFRQSRSCL